MPGLDHDVHEKTRIGADYRHGCHSKPRPTVHSGYFAPDRLYRPDGTWVVRQSWVPFVMSIPCRNDVSLVDMACEGCPHRGQGELYADRIRKEGT